MGEIQAKKSEILSGMAQEAIKRSDGPEAQIEWLESKVVERIGYMPDGLLGECVLIACHEAVYRARASSRVSTKRNSKPANPPSTGPGTMAGVLEAHVDRILEDWQTELGKKLGDLTADELLGLAERERQTARGHQINARFYKLLSSEVGDGAVRDSISNEKARILLTRAQNEVQ